MRCKKCNAQLAKHDLWCMQCGTQSPVVKTDLSAMKSLKKTREGLRGKIAEMVPAIGFSIILGVIPVAVLIFIFHSYVHPEGGLQLLLNLALKGLVFSIFVPFILLPFSVISKDESSPLELKALLSRLKKYPQYFVFCLFSAFFFVAIYIICFGFPGFASDPMLRLVWLVLVNYWAAIAIPALVIMERKSLNPIKAIGKSYRHFHDVRWNIYLLLLVLGVMNLLAFALALFPMLFTLALSYYAIRDYTILLEEYELLEYRL
jgi:hypothetical protein